VDTSCFGLFCGNHKIYPQVFVVGRFSFIKTTNYNSLPIHHNHGIAILIQAGVYMKLLYILPNSLVF
jgi:hypothetical protein